MEKLSSKKKAEIWVIGGSKGGTGKTFIASIIGTYLARKGKKVILVDADLGGANLHSLFGIDRPKKSLTNFFETKVPLNELLVETGIENMSLITGDIHSLASDNIIYTQKLKLFRHIKKLNTQYVLIDVGAGTHNNVIDTFLFADKKIAVLVPELLAIENMYHFVKNALFRKLRMALRAYDFKGIAHETWADRETKKIRNLRGLIDYLMGLPDIGDIIQEELSDFKICLILNKIRNKQDLFIGASIKSTFTKYLGISTQYVGFMEYDDSIWRSIRQRQPFMPNQSSSRLTKEIELFTENLLRGKEIRLLKE